MARLKYFTRSLFSGYGATGSNIIYTLVSVPLALAYLSREEFGLWGLIAQIMLYIQLAEAGITGASARILIDYKDDRVQFAVTLKTVSLIFTLQAMLIILLGCSLAPLLARFLEIPAHLATQFVMLLRLYTLVFGFAYALKIFDLTLFAFQRVDVINYGHIIGFGLQLGTLWLSFNAGFGLWSVLAAYGTGVIWLVVLRITCTYWLGLIPENLSRKPFSRTRFLEVFHYGKDRVLVIAGQQILLASPALLITKFLGLEATAAWTVGTRLLVLCQRLIHRLHDSAYPALAEMYVRNEHELFANRFKALTLFALALGSVAAAMIAGLNNEFVHFWTSGKIEWSWELDAVLCVWFLLSLSSRCHWIAISITKQIGMMRYVYFFEAIVLIGAGCVGLRIFGLLSMPAALSLTALSFSFPYTLWRTSRLLKRPFLDIGGRWFLPMFKILVPLIVLGVILRLSDGIASGPTGFCLRTVLLGTGAIFLMLLQPAVRVPLREVLGIGHGSATKTHASASRQGSIDGGG